VKFKDHFSTQAREYAKFRPHYPPALFAFLAANSPNDQLALDCATGNGQAAILLAERFRKVIAIDASAAQIENALPNERVEYRVAPAEETSLSAESCDAITVAQALHWFDLGQFYAEVRRLLRPGGILAVWTYKELQTTSAVEVIVRHYHDEVVGPYWPAERKLVGEPYRQLPFPFAEIDCPPFRAEMHWSLAELNGYLWTWSATQRFIAVNKKDPRESIARELAQAWGDPESKQLIVWPLIVRIGRAWS
jgi:ubiquinone/menaquinone biosynthesis C-methylase UbiE